MGIHVSSDDIAKRGTIVGPREEVTSHRSVVYANRSRSSNLGRGQPDVDRLPKISFKE